MSGVSAGLAAEGLDQFLLRVHAGFRERRTVSRERELSPTTHTDPGADGVFRMDAGEWVGLGELALPNRNARPDLNAPRYLITAPD